MKYSKVKLRRSDILLDQSLPADIESDTDYDVTCDLTIAKGMRLSKKGKHISELGPKEQRRYLAGVIKNIIDTANGPFSHTRITKCVQVFEVQPQTTNLHTHVNFKLSSTEYIDAFMADLKHLVKKIGFNLAGVYIAWIKYPVERLAYLLKPLTKYPDYYIKGTERSEHRGEADQILLTESQAAILAAEIETLKRQIDNVEPAA